MKILLTGGAGFLGRHVARAASAAGHEVLVLSRHPDRVGALPRSVHAVAGDLTRPESLGQLPDWGAQVVIHAAAIVADDDPNLAEVNVSGTGNLLAALARAVVVPRLVHVSTFAVEDIPPTAYSESKLRAEEAVRKCGLPFVVLRPSLIYGRGDGTNTPALVERLRSGSHWLPAGGRATRIQPVHVEDVAAAVLAASERAGIEGGTYRLGGPEPMTVRAWRLAVRDACGGRAVIRAIPLPLFSVLASGLALLGKDGPASVLAFHQSDHAVDIEAARRDLGFAPRLHGPGLQSCFADGRLLSDRAGPPNRPAGAAPTAR